MKKNTDKWNELVIDEDKHTSAPTFSQRIKHVLMAMLMGAVFAQVILFALRMGSVAFYLLQYTELTIAYLIICAILGWFYGDKFINSLGKESGNWWNLWRDW